VNGIAAFHSCSHSTDRAIQCLPLSTSGLWAPKATFSPAKMPPLIAAIHNAIFQHRFRRVEMTSQKWSFLTATAFALDETCFRDRGMPHSPRRQLLLSPPHRAFHRACHTYIAKTRRHADRPAIGQAIRAADHKPPPRRRALKLRKDQWALPERGAWNERIPYDKFGVATS
jgi:hypothetical protein